MSPATRFRDLPLVWKLLLPYITLLTIVGAAGAFLVVRDLRTRAQVALDRELTVRLLDARATLNDRALYAHEAATFAANIQGMAAVLARHDRRAGAALLGSVLALKTDLSSLVAVDEHGLLVAAFARDREGAPPHELAGGGADQALVGAAIADPSGAPSSALVDRDGVATLLVVAPVCTGTATCGAAGAAVAGIDLGRLTRSAADDATFAPAAGASGLAIFGAGGELLATAGSNPPRAPVDVPIGRLVRRPQRVGGNAVTVLYAPLDVDGHRVGTLAVSLPTDPAFAGVRAAAWRVTLITLAAILATAAIGAPLSRSILAQVRPLVLTNRNLGQGDLSARAPVLGRDELGELAGGFNVMAEQLQASYANLELRVEQRTAEVQRLLQERTDLFTSVSHELRTPLAVILAQADGLQDASYDKNDAWCAEVGRVVEASARQLLGFVNDILELARAEAGGIELHVEEVSIGPLLAGLRDTFAAVAERAGVRLSVRAPAALPSVRADAARLEEVMRNLLDNAVKYTPAGGHVLVDAAEEGRAVVVSVSDTGIGIPLDVGDRVFEPFYRVKGSRTQHDEPSSGLGLAVTRRLVEAQGATISYRPADGGGTTFVLSLPATSAAD